MSAGQKVLIGNIRGPKGDPGDISLAVPLTQKGAANGVATLDGTSQIPANQLSRAVLTSLLGSPSGVATLDSSSHVPAVQLALAVLLADVGVANGVASLDSGGQVPVSQLGNVQPSTNAWDFYPEDYGATPAKIATDVSVSNSLTFSSPQMAVDAAIGMWVMIDGGRGTDDTASVGTITAISGNNITIAASSGRSIDVTQTGLNAVYGSDSTNAINACIAAAKAYAEAHNYDVNVWITKGPYIAATNNQSDDGTALYNTSIKVLHPTNNNGRKLAISLRGNFRADFLNYWNASVPNIFSSTIFGLAAAPFPVDGTFGPQSVIGTAYPSSGGGMAGSFSPTFVNVRPMITNIQVVTPAFTNLTAFDFTRATGVYMDGWAARVFATSEVGNGVHLLNAWSGATIDNTAGCGVRTPEGGNNADVFLGSGAVEGYCTGASVASEHTFADYLRLLYTSVALQVQGGSTCHGLVIGHVTAEGYKGGLQLKGGGSGKVPIYIHSWSTETSGSVYDISDPGNAFLGYINWYDTVDNRDIIVTGAANLKINIPTIYRVVPKVVALTDGTTVALNARDGNVYEWPLGANSHTLSNPTNPVDGQIITIDIAYSGAFTPNFGTAYAFGADGQPTWTATNAKVDTVAFRYNAGKAKWLCLGSKLGF